MSKILLNMSGSHGLVDIEDPDNRAALEKAGLTFPQPKPFEVPVITFVEYEKDKWMRAFCDKEPISSEFLANSPLHKEWLRIAHACEMARRAQGKIEEEIIERADIEYIRNLENWRKPDCAIHAGPKVKP